MEVCEIGTVTTQPFSPDGVWVFLSKCHIIDVESVEQLRDDVAYSCGVMKWLCRAAAPALDVHYLCRRGDGGGSALLPGPIL